MRCVLQPAPDARWGSAPCGLVSHWRQRLVDSGQAQALGSSPASPYLLTSPRLHMAEAFAGLSREGQPLAALAGQMDALVTFAQHVAASVVEEHGRLRDGGKAVAAASFFRRGCLDRMAIDLVPAPTHEAAACLSALARQGHVPASYRGHGFSLRVSPTTSSGAPYDVVVKVTNIPPGFGLSGFTAQLLTCAGIEVQQTPFPELGSDAAWVAAEVLAEDLGQGGIPVLGIPVINQLTAFVLAPASDPSLSRMPRRCELALGKTVWITVHATAGSRLADEGGAPSRSPHANEPQGSAPGPSPAAPLQGEVPSPPGDPPAAARGQHITASPGAGGAHGRAAGAQAPAPPPSDSGTATQLPPQGLAGPGLEVFKRWEMSSVASAGGVPAPPPPPPRRPLWPPEPLRAWGPDAPPPMEWGVHAPAAPPPWGPPTGMQQTAGTPVSGYGLGPLAGLPLHLPTAHQRQLPMPPLWPSSVGPPGPGVLSGMALMSMPQGMLPDPRPSGHSLGPQDRAQQQPPRMLHQWQQPGLLPGPDTRSGPGMASPLQPLGLAPSEAWPFMRLPDNLDLGPPGRPAAPAAQLQVWRQDGSVPFPPPALPLHSMLHHHGSSPGLQPLDTPPVAPPVMLLPGETAPGGRACGDRQPPGLPLPAAPARGPPPGFPAQPPVAPLAGDPPAAASRAAAPPAGRAEAAAVVATQHSRPPGQAVEPASATPCRPAPPRALGSTAQASPAHAVLLQQVQDAAVARSNAPRAGIGHEARSPAPADVLNRGAARRATTGSHKAPRAQTHSGMQGAAAPIPAVRSTAVGTPLQQSTLRGPTAVGGPGRALQPAAGSRRGTAGTPSATAGTDTGRAGAHRRQPPAGGASAPAASAAAGRQPIAAKRRASQRSSPAASVDGDRAASSSQPAPSSSADSDSDGDAYTAFCLKPIDWERVQAALAAGRGAKQPRLHPAVAPPELAGTLDTCLQELCPALPVCRVPYGRDLVLNSVRAQHSDDWQTAVCEPGDTVSDTMRGRLLEVAATVQAAFDTYLLPGRARRPPPPPNAASPAHHRLRPAQRSGPGAGGE